MSSVVQAKCPGCRQVLRIPVEWLKQPFRCKHCGATINAKQIAPVPAGVPEPTRQKAAAPAPVGKKTTSVSSRKMPVEKNDTAFADLRTDDEDRRESRPKRRQGGGWWKGALVALGVLAIAGGIMAVAWTRIIALLKTPELVQVIEDIKTGPKEPAPNPDPSDNPKGKDANGKTEEPPRTGTAFPRRMLVVSIHNYLFANSISEGTTTARSMIGRNVQTLVDKIGDGFKIPPAQRAHLSDTAAKGQNRPPMKLVVENTLANYLESSRAQDRILVFFIGHAVEIGDEAYLVPIEGELENAATLIPLKWVYEQLKACKARQKVLVLDVNRVNPTRGQERPGGGAMGPKLDEAIKNPPSGVQVWSSCSAEQASYETEMSAMSVFLDELNNAAGKGVQGKIQKPDDAFPLEYFRDVLNKAMKAELDPQRLVQVSRLTGQETEGGTAYDPKEAAPPAPTLAGIPANVAGANARLAESVLDEIDLPPVKATRDGGRLKFEWLPSFTEDAMKDYKPDAADTDEQKKVRQAIDKARVVLWAVSTSSPSIKMADEVKQVKQEVKFDLSILQDGYRFNPNEKQFKDKVFSDEKHVAHILARLNEALEELNDVKENLDMDSKRWRANYDFVRARVEMQLAYVTEYQSMLGKIRIELPARDAKVHGGWRLASTLKPQGDSGGKKHATNARKTLDKIITDHKGTPWEVLAKRERLTALGLEWQPAR